MMINILYLCVGCIVGVLIKHQIDYSNSKKRLQNKIATYASIQDTDLKLKQCDEILQSIKSLNENLQIIQKKKGV